MTKRLSKWSSLLLAITVIFSMQNITVYAESLSENSVELSECDESDSVSENEILHEEYYEQNSDISQFRFTIPDIRGSQYNKVFNGSDGKYTILIMGDTLDDGGYTQCNIENVLEASKYLDLCNLNIYVIDKGKNDTASRAEIVSYLNGLGVTNEICFANYKDSTELTDFYWDSGCRTCGTPGNVFFKNKEGIVFALEKGVLTEREALYILGQGGYPYYYDPEMLSLNISGTVSYDKAYELLNLINAERRKNGYSELQMDQCMMNAAIRRAGECAIVESSTRPNGLAYYTACERIQAETLSSDTSSATNALQDMMSSTSDKKAILNPSYNAVGIGVFYNNGRWNWAVCYSNTFENAAKKLSDQKVMHKIFCTKKYLPEMMNVCSYAELGVSPIRTKFISGNALIDPTTFEWNCQDEEILRLDIDNGNINALMPGYTFVRVVLYNDGTRIMNVGFSVTVLDEGESIEDYYVDYNEIDIDEFVRRMYEKALNREAEDYGLQNWTFQLYKQEIDGAGIANGFINSAEFTNRNLSNTDFLDTLYETFFNRAADAGGKAYWMQQLSNGMSRTEVLSGFVNSQEFSNLCDKYGIARGTMQPNGSSIYRPGVRNYVLRMYTKALNRAGETVGVEDWTNRINTGTMSAEKVAKSFFNSEEFINRNLNDADYVETLYQTFMDRPSDVGGKQYWLNKLNSGMSREQVLEGFSRSREFTKIMWKYGIYKQ
ncbi:MAG: DUF4214 domain-containing protein [Lachnospiraceae bacterium]|nr:DUF4214 domain-containing protein [Lachnospiraceae bacterium]